MILRNKRKLSILFSVYHNVYDYNLSVFRIKDFLVFICTLLYFVRPRLYRLKSSLFPFRKIKVSVSRKNVTDGDTFEFITLLWSMD